MKTKLLRKLRKNFEIRKTISNRYVFIDKRYINFTIFSDKYISIKTGSKGLKECLFHLHILMAHGLKKKFEKKILP